MEYTLELLRRHGIRTVLATLHYLADEVMAYFGNGSDWEMRLLYSVEDEPLGTAGSIKRVEEYLSETFLVISGDALTDFDLTAAAEFHRQNKAAATIILTRVSNPLEFGMVITDEQQRVSRFLEKPSWGEVFSDHINTGIYILEPSVLALIDPGQPFDFSTDLFPKMLEQNLPIYGYVAEGYWCDIGSPEQYRQAQLDVLEGRVDLTIPGQLLRDGIWVGTGAQIDPTAILRGPLVIGRNCRIRQGARLGQYSVMGDNCIVEQGAQVDRVVIWDNTYIGQSSRCFGSILCRSVTLKGNVTIGEGAVVGDNVFVGQGATLQPEVKIYPGKNVEPGANVSLSLVWGRKWPGSLFGEDGITGLANIEITPEYALKLGAAYGAVLAKGAVVMCSRDAHPATRMLNRALNCGLLSVGVSVRDLQVLPATLARNAIKNTTGALGGVHCRVSGDDPRSILVEFYDADGIIIDRTMERKIENKFFREDFRRTTMDEVGVIDFPARTVDKYIEEFTQNLRLDVVKQAKFRVVIDYSYGCGSQALPSVLGKLGCEVVSLNAHLDPERSREQQGNPARALEQLASIVRTLKADFGARIDPSAERLTIVDETGRLIAESSLLVLFCLLVFRQVKGALVAVPVSAPSIIKTLAKQHGGRVIETRTDARSLTYTATLGESRIALAGTSYGGFVFPGFSPGFDAMFALARLLEMISAEKQPLSTLFSWVPDFQLNHFSVYCDFPNKGRVMRLLLEDLRDQRLELVDGLKVLLPDGWVLVVPDRSQPELQIWVEAGTEKACQELSREYEQKLSTLEARSREAIQSPVTRKITGKPSGKSAVPVTEDRAFHFWTPGRYLGVRARTLREFVDTLHYIEVESLRYHSERGDFANWLEYELGDIEMAKQIRALRSTGAAGEELRQGLLTVLTQEQEAVL